METGEERASVGPPKTKDEILIKVSKLKTQ
jgi:hypothetical protein